MKKCRNEGSPNLEISELQIREERPGDQTAIYEVTRVAFEPMPYSDGNEQELVDLLRENGALTISLVATRRDEVVGHVAFSPADSQTPGWYSLGPVSVLPELQRQGIGRKLIGEGLDRLRSLGAVGCILVGDPRYYSQVGFQPAPESAPGRQPAEFFMVSFLSGEPTPIPELDFHSTFYQ